MKILTKTFRSRYGFKSVGAGLAAMVLVGMLSVSPAAAVSHRKNKSAC